MLSNFPVWLFDCEGRDPRWPTFGLMLVEPRPAGADRRTGCRSGARRRARLAGRLRQGARLDDDGGARPALPRGGDFARTIPIPTLGVGTTEFDIPPDAGAALYESGRDGRADFLDRWDFDAYIHEYRSRGAAHWRRDAVGARLRAAA